MEKIGLFDLIDKFAAPKTDGKTFSPAAENARGSVNAGETNGGHADKNNSVAALRDPDFGAQPQYMMNAKLAAFLKRHETLKADVPPAPVRRPAKIAEKGADKTKSAPKSAKKRTPTDFIAKEKPRAARKSPKKEG